MAPPVNPDCRICFNLDATRLRDKGLTIEIHGNEDFRLSAASRCLACKMIHDGVTRFTRSTEDFPSVTLELIEGDGNLLEGPTGQSLLAKVKRVNWGDRAEHCKRPLWDDDSGVFLFLEFYTPPDTPSIWDAIPCRPEPALDRASDFAVKRVKSWLEMCDSFHPICCLPNAPPLPTRVIFVGEEDSFRLMISNGEHANYAALTWPWGPRDKYPPKTLWGNLQERTKGAWESPLPPLFTDAIKFTRKLGLNYLWIDALCIIQDSAEDKRRELPKMTEIYNNAYLTIAADSCASAAEQLTGQGEEYIFDPKRHHIAEGRDEGIPIHHLASDGSLRNLLRAKTPMAAPGLNKPTTTVGVRYIDRKTSHGYHGVTFAPKSHLDNRGWCFQENVLSRRLLHFGQTELSFQCLEMEACECTSIPKPYAEETDRHLVRLKRKLLLEETDMGEAWLDAVESFTYRDLSEDNDRLNAIAGIAQKIADRFPANEAKYLYGIWRSEIETQLAWLVIPPVRYLRPVPLRGSKRQVIAPSWSWASVTGAVKFQRWARFRVLSIQFVPDDIGQASAYVTVWGRLCKTVTLWHTQKDTAMWQSLAPNLTHNTYAETRGSGTEPVEAGHVIFDKWSFKDGIERDLTGYSALENVNGLGFAMLLRRIANPRFGPEGIELYQRVGVIYPERALKYYNTHPDKEKTKSQYETYGIEEQMINII